MTHVLVVDDERFFREAIRDLLEQDAHACLMAESVAQALEQGQDPRVGVVVLDVELPDGSGLDVLRRLRESRPELRVVVLSAHTEQEVVLEALRLGACDYLAKPLHEEEVRLSVRRALETYELGANLAALRSRLGTMAGALEDLLEAETGGREELATRVAELVGRVLEAGKTSVLLRDEGGQQLRVAAATGRALPAGELDSVPVGEGVAGRVVASGEPILVDDALGDTGFPASPEDRYESSSFVVTPLGRGAQCWGALCATDRHDGRSFSQEDLALMRLVALALSTRVEQGSSAVAPDEASAEPQPDLDAELARAVCEAVTREVEPERVLGEALRAVGERLEAAPASLYLFDAEGGVLRREAQWGHEAGGDRETLARDAGLSGVAFASGQPLRSDDPSADERFDPATDTSQSGEAGPLLLLPLHFRGKTLGLVRAFPRRRDALSSRTAQVLGAALSAAVRNALLYRSLVDSIEEVAQARREASQG